MKSKKADQRATDAGPLSLQRLTLWSHIVIVLFLAMLAPLRAQSTAFTYQGRLNDNGLPASGLYDVTFVVRDAATNQIGPTLLTNGILVLNGAFAASLDFGAGVFTGAPRWLEIGVRGNGTFVPFTTLLPRQPISAAPYAMQALVASNVLGPISDSQLSANIPRLNASQQFNSAITFSPLFGPPFSVGLTNTNKVTWLNADLIDGLDSSVFARSNHTHSAIDVTSGTLADARLSPNVPLLGGQQLFSGSNSFAGVVNATNTSNTFSGSFAGNGGGLSNLSAAAVTGTVPDTALPATAARLSSNQTFTGTVTFSPASGPPLRVGSSALVTNLNAELLGGVPATALWNVAGNGGTTNGNFIGTLDNQPLEFRANGSRVLRVSPTGTAPNIIGGSAANSAASNSVGAVVAGGTGNTAGNNYSVVGGGQNNSATNFGATVPGGLGNVAGGFFSFAAGRNARALHDGSFVWNDNSGALFTSAVPNTVIFRATGGVGIGTNAPQSALHVAGGVQADALKLTASPSAGAILTSDASGNAAWSPAAVRIQTNGTSPNIISGSGLNAVANGVVGATIGGGGSLGASNYVGANYGTVAGGQANSALGQFASVAGGQSNLASNRNATVSGGATNIASGISSTVSGGTNNQASGYAAVVAGGDSNRASGQSAAVVAGQNNTASGSGAVVGGGFLNLAAGLRSVVAGGEQNTATNNYSAVVGGVGNTASGYASIAGGSNNSATNDYSTALGFGSIAGGRYSVAVGYQARALHDGSFVFADNSSIFTFNSTAPNQFLIRAAGGVGIGAAPVDGLLSISGNTHINDNDIFLRGGSDQNHGLGWYGSGKPFASALIDGPVLYGWSGGGLGTLSGGAGLALRWNSAEQVGIGTAPSVRFHVGDTAQQIAILDSSSTGGTWVGIGNSSVGGLRWNLISTGSANSETAGNLVFYANGGKVTFRSSGNVGIGTSDPGDRLELGGFDTAMRIRNLNDVGGGFLGNTYGVLQLGMFNPSTNSFGIVGANSRRSMFGMDANGKVGSLANNYFSPIWRNILDDGAGNMTVSSGSLGFGSSTRQMLNLWSDHYALGVQNNTLYSRSDGNFAWFRQGSHSDTTYDPGGGGTVLMKLDPSGLTVNGTFVSSSDRNLKEQFGAVNPQEILAKIVALPITTWNYKQDPGTRHLGPMAQDFHAAFGLGADDKHIATVDADGIALAAIKGLHQILKEDQERIKTLEARLAAAERRLASQHEAAATVENRLAALERILSRKTDPEGETSAAIAKQ